MTPEAMAVKQLEELTLVGPDSTRLPDAQVMLSTIEEVEQKCGSEITPSLAGALADAILSYTSWFVRGADRKPFLERAVRYYRLSSNKEKLGCLLVEEAQVRNLKEAVSLLEELYVGSKSYVPALCHYADALYKDGQYIRAYEAAVHINKLAHNDPKWNSRPESIPTMPMAVAAKALRAEARRLEKLGEQREALAVLKQLQELGQATPNDIKRLERLRRVKQGTTGESGHVR